MNASITRGIQKFKHEIHINGIAYVLAAPMAIMIIVVIIIPIIRVVYMSFFDYYLARPNNHPFIGLQNYTKLFMDKTFFVSVRVTLIYIFVTVILRYVLGLGIALLLHEKFPGRGLARSIMIIPWAVPEVVACLIFIQMFDYQYGIINYWLSQLGIIHEPLKWLADLRLALPSAMLVNIWKGTPWAAIMLLAGLQSIPESLYEAAKIDGANAWQRFRNVTLPLLKPISLAVFLLLVIWTIKDFAIVYVLNKGGPARATEVLTIFLYHKGFEGLRMGVASAAGVILLVVSMLFTIIYLKAMEGDESVW
jgi:multiple sugar transport system permease protein